jgi:inner membrane protein
MMEDMASRIREWATSSIFLRVLFLGFLILLLQIPILQIDQLTYERENTRQSAVYEVTGLWGGAQTLMGPFLVIPYRYKGFHQQGWTVTETRHAYFLPDQLDVRAAMTTEVRRRGIFDVPLYRADLRFEGAFAHPDFSEWEIPPEDILWNRATLVVGLSHPSAIQEPAHLDFAGRKIAFRPGKGETPFLPAGISARLPGLPATTSSESNPFSYTLKLNGAEQLMFQPSGEITKVQMESDWPHPSFGGRYLPKSSQVLEDGFTAEWQVLHFGRNYPQKWIFETVDQEAIQGSELGVELLSPVDAYRMSKRTVKYEFLFTFLTFAAFFLFEIFNRLKVHSIQYLLIGAGLCLFYLLTLSLSEHLGFEIAYGLAALAVVGLVSIYCIQILGSRAWSLSAVLFALYGFLFMLLSLEDYSLLIGSMGLFAILAAVMFLTRNIDWSHITDRS